MPPPQSKARLIGLLGALGCSIVLTVVPQFEGTKLVGYKDPIGIITDCTGDTTQAVLGKRYTKEQCRDILIADLADHAEGVLACVPQLKGNTFPLAAATSFDFNVGDEKFCNSTMANKFREGDIQGACNEFPKWNMAGGHVLPGLVKRRAAEKAICEGRVG